MNHCLSASRPKIEGEEHLSHHEYLYCVVRGATIYRKVHDIDFFEGRNSAPVHLAQKSTQLLPSFTQ
jgi:hypothetical protein